MWGAFLFIPNVAIEPQHTPNTQTPQIPYISFSVVPSLVNTHVYLCSLTFSLRPDEAASAWRQ